MVQCCKSDAGRVSEQKRKLQSQNSAKLGTRLATRRPILATKANQKHDFSGHHRAKTGQQRPTKA
eukprot:3349308-Amphidinium_carterae.1